MSVFSVIGPPLEKSERAFRTGLQYRQKSSIVRTQKGEVPQRGSENLALIVREYVQACSCVDCVDVGFLVGKGVGLMNMTVKGQGMVDSSAAESDVPYL